MFPRSQGSHLPGQGRRQNAPPKKPARDPIHHLADDEKQRLFARIFRMLRKPGVFLNLDQIRGETPDLQRLYWQQWLAHVRRAGATEAEIQASIKRRQEYDRDALLADQLGWLKAAGFASVDCVYKHYFVGVFLAMKTD